MSSREPPATKPRTRKGRSSQEALLAAGRTVFGREGYAAARVSDIAAQAGLSTGAFYWYYRDKRDLLIAQLTRLLEELLEQAHAPWRADLPAESVRLTTDRYLRFYQANADLFRVLHETMQTDAEVEAMQADTRRHFHERIARMIRRGIERGLVRHSLDPELGAALLGGMTEHYAYTRFVLHRYPERDISEVSAGLAELWARGAFTEVGLRGSAADERALMAPVPQHLPRS